jgi:hypothetical protein
MVKDSPVFGGAAGAAFILVVVVVPGVDCVNGRRSGRIKNT